MRDRLLDELTTRSPPRVRTPEDGLTGVANLLAVVAPMYLMCDPRDIAVVPQIRSPHAAAYDIYL